MPLSSVPFHQLKALFNFPCPKPLPLGSDWHNLLHHPITVSWGADLPLPSCRSGTQALLGQLLLSSTSLGKWGEMWPQPGECCQAEQRCVPRCASGLQDRFFGEKNENPKIALKVSLKVWSLSFRVCLKEGMKPRHLKRTLFFEHWLPPALPFLLPTYHLHSRTPPSFLPSFYHDTAGRYPCEKVTVLAGPPLAARGSGAVDDILAGRVAELCQPPWAQGCRQVWAPVPMGRIWIHKLDWGSWSLWDIPQTTPWEMHLALCKLSYILCW